ncbi:hypothetical protein ACH5RR_037389 [Cinchona calisaya]|uniref:Uncharacterized protein n=1 Tax=Cinchona calisaya TaxID=153742 RepID=A0ABD2Y7F1_9GENT
MKLDSDVPRMANVSKSDWHMLCVFWGGEGRGRDRDLVSRKLEYARDGKLERQAQDRVHKIGQYKPIRIVRIVIKNRAEERILRLQEKKELAFEWTVGDGSSEALGKLGGEDLRYMFQA